MTINEMIFKTITTKCDKEPVYKEVLEVLGYKVIKSDMSYYGYWEVQNPKTGRVAVISKGRNNGNKGLFNPNEYVKGDIKKIDYVNYLKTDRRLKNAAVALPKIIVLRSDIAREKQELARLESLKGRVEEEERIVRKRLDICDSKIKDSKSKLKVLRKEVKERKMGK